MTAFLAQGEENPTSRVTVATLEDLGYAVDYSAADTYDASNLSESCICNRRHLGHDNSTKEKNSRRRLNEREFNPVHQRAADLGVKLLRSRTDILFPGQRSGSIQTEVANTLSVIYRNLDGSFDDVVVSV